MNQDLLFSENSLSFMLTNQLRSIRDEVVNLSEEIILEEDIHVPVDAVYKRFHIRKLELSLEDAVIDTPKKIENRFIDDFGRYREIQGEQIDILIPFKGESFLFKYLPSKFTTVFPRGQVSNDSDNGGGVLILSFSIFQNEKKSLKELFDSEKELLVTYCKWVNWDVDQFNRKAKEGDIPTEIKKHKASMFKSKQNLASLNLPIVNKSPIKKPNPKEITGFRFDNNFMSIQVKYSDGTELFESFSKTQTQALQFMDQEHKKGRVDMPQIEIINATDSVQTRIRQVFKRTKNKKTETHPLFGEIIKHNNTGNYRLLNKQIP